MSDKLTFKISIPSQGGFHGRECNNPDCRKYFKIHQDSLKDEMYCPYCGLLFNKNELFTPDQLKYAQEVGKEKATSYIHDEVNRMLGRAFGNLNSQSKGGLLNISASYKPAIYEEKFVFPPVEKQVDSEIECSECKAKFQVYGIFGYCPLCKCDNIIIYDANISIILSAIANANNKDRELRHAYNDLVSTFEDFFKKRNKSQKKYNFQNLESVDSFFSDNYGINFFGELSKDEALTIKRLFQKRHVCQHNKGIIDQKYINIIPEDASLLNQIAPLCLEEFKDTTAIMRKMLLRII
jgi:hypothetical protein